MSDIEITGRVGDRWNWEYFVKSGGEYYVLYPTFRGGVEIIPINHVTYTKGCSGLNVSVADVLDTYANRLICEEISTLTGVGLTSTDIQSVVKWYKMQLL